MIPRRRSAAVAIAVLISIVGAVGVASAASPKSVTVGLGARLIVKGTGIHCAVANTAPVTMTCGLASARDPRAGSYGFRISDQRIAFLHSSATRQPTVALTRKQPTFTGALFPRPASKHSGVVTVVENEAVFVARTHISCAITPVAGRASVACGLLSTSSAGYYVPGTFAGVVTGTVAGVVRTEAGGTEKTVARQLQP